MRSHFSKPALSGNLFLTVALFMLCSALPMQAKRAFFQSQNTKNEQLNYQFSAKNLVCDTLFSARISPTSTKKSLTNSELIDSVLARAIHIAVRQTATSLHAETPLRVAIAPDFVRSLALSLFAQRRFGEHITLLSPTQKDSAYTAEFSTRTITVKELRLTYRAVESPDSISRIAECTGIATSFTGKTPEPMRTLCVIALDTIARADISALESYADMLYRPAIPPREHTAWEKIAEPILIISAAVASVVLFFFLRTQ